MPLNPSNYDSALISMGIQMIIPSLTRFGSMSPVWARLEVLVVALGQVEELVGLTDQPMRSLDELRVESVGAWFLRARLRVSVFLSVHTVSVGESVCSLMLLLFVSTGKSGADLPQVSFTVGGPRLGSARRLRGFGSTGD